MFASVWHCRRTKGVFSGLLLPLLASLIAGSLWAAAVKPGVAFQGVQTTIATGVGIPHGTAVDDAGNVYVVDLTSAHVLKIPRATTVSACAVSGNCMRIGSGFVDPTAIALDGKGNVYVVDRSTQALYKVAANGAQTTLATGLTQPSGVAIAKDGTAFVAVSGSIVRVTPTGTISTYATGPTQAGGIALAGNGDLYVADAGGDRVLKITSVGAVIVVATGLSSPQAVAVDGAGNIYVADTGNSRIVSLPSNAVALVCPVDCTVSSAHVNSPGGVGADPNGTLYIADTGNQQIVKLAQDADFGTAAINAPGSTTLTFNYRLFGSSCAAPPTVSVVARGTTSKDFAYNQSETTCTPGPTDLLKVTVRFAPLSPGLREGAVQLVDSTGVPQVGTYLHGIGSGPQITWTPGLVRTVLANPAPASP